MKIPTLVLLSSLVALCKSSSDHDPIVKLPSGKIRGKFEDGYYSFHNIPYSIPPVGRLRFAPPIPYNDSWTDIKDSSQPMRTCIKFGKSFQLSGSEDCLYLHIATPSITCEQAYPVRVHIHGGGYMSGSPDNSDTSILVRRGMVVVTMGYRLGPLGFLSTGDKVISGNNGLKDQRLAIKWTKGHIQTFCGDPNKILLAGVSAGGSSAHLHLLHKLTESYVNAVASHNGVTTCPWAFESNPQEISAAFAELLNCPTDSEALKGCLQSKNVEELMQATSSFQVYKGNPFTVFAPVVEPSDSEDPFIIEHPEDIMKNGKAANVTWLVGYTEREGSCNAAQFLSLDQEGTPEINILNERWSELAPTLLFFNKSMTKEEQSLYSALLKDLYLGKEEFSEKNYRLLEDMYSDVLFRNEIEKAIELHRKHCPGKVYVYYYKYPHSYGLGNVFSSRTDVSFGADHLADTIFTIPVVQLKQASLSERDKKVSEKLLDMYLTWGNTGVLSFGGKELPVNTPIEERRLTINENCFSIDGCINERDVGCTCHGYD